MKFRLHVADFRKALAGTENQIATAVTAAMREATDGLKADLRQDVTGAGLGQRLANTWRGKTYPDSGVSVEAAAYVWTKAPKLIDAYERGVTIRPREGRFLAIPTQYAGRRIGREKITPQSYERRTGQTLRFVKGKGSSSFLVASPRAKTTRRRRGAAMAQKSVIVFILVPQARVQKRLDVQGIAERWAARVPDLISRHWV